MKCIRNFVLFKDCKDLQSLITPSGYRSISWNTAPDGDWLLRMASLAYDLLQIAPNTKIGGKKLTDAIKKLLETGDVTNGSGRDAGKFTDLCSLLIRICLAQFRVLKRDMTKRSIVFRRLEKEDRTRFILILERIQLPAEFDDQSDDEQDMEVPCFNPKPAKEDESLSSAVAIVPFGTGQGDSQASMDFDISAFGRVLAEEPPLPAPSTPPPAKGSNAFISQVSFASAEERSRKRKVQEGVGFKLSPRVQDSPPPAPAKQKRDGQDVDIPVSDDDLLQAALDHVPKASSVAKVLKRPSANMKRPSSSMKRPAAHEGDDATGDDDADVAMDDKEAASASNDGQEDHGSQVSCHNNFACLMHENM